MDYPVFKKLKKLGHILQYILEELEKMTVQLDTLTVKVAETLEVEQSAIVLIQGLAAQLADIKDDPAAIQALADQLDAKADELAVAIANFTPPVTPP